MVAEVQAVKVVVEDTITMAAMGMVIAMEIIAIQPQEVVHLGGLLVESSVVSSAASSVSFSARMELVKDAVSAVKQKEKDHSIRAL